MRGRRIWPLALAFLVLLSTVAALVPMGIQTHTPYFNQQMDARARMEVCSEAIRRYRAELGIPMSEFDLHQTGLLGEEFNEITTSIGDLEAKRTAADPDMAALLVRLFHEANLRPGDRICASFSGSFPGLNLAVLCAADAMELEISLISSVGASTYGANLPELSFPEMTHRLYSDGLISVDSALVTLGGDADNGKGVLNEARMDEISARLSSLGLTVMREPNLQKNLAVRRTVFEQGPIDCFVSVGGNLTSVGRNDAALSLGQGLLHQTVAPRRLTDESGLVEHYLAQEIPVISLLNIRQLVADYGMPFDPSTQFAPGESPAYYMTEYPIAPILFGIVLSIALLCFCRKHR